MNLSKHVKELTISYTLEPEDVAYCELRANGWSESEAAFYAFHLTYSEPVAIRRWILNHITLRPRIPDLIADLKARYDLKSQRAAAAANMSRQIEEEVERRINEFKQSIETSSRSKESMSKEDLDRMYINIMHDDHADPKTKMDASKAYVAIHPEMKADQSDEEDDRINFFLPVNCHYCDRCKNCELKTELEKRGCRIRAKRTSPYLWEMVSDTEDVKQLKDTSE